MAPGTLSMSPYVATWTPSRASTIASSMSRVSVTHTGQPGPINTLSPGGNLVRSPNLAIACS